MALKTAILFSVLSAVSCYTCKQNSSSAALWTNCPECSQHNTSLVCGTNNITYVNKCLVDCLNTKLYKGKTQITIAYNSRCQHEELITPYQCGDTLGGVEDCSECRGGVLDPVCGSDKETHDNACFFNCTARIQKQQGMDLEITHRGMCDPALGNRTHEYVCVRNQTEFKQYPEWYIIVECDQDFRVPYYCPECSGAGSGWSPYCGTDNHTYGNDCLFQCAVRRNKEQGKSVPKKAHSGSCLPAWDQWFIFFRNVSKNWEDFGEKCAIGDLTALRVKGRNIQKADTTDCGECGTRWIPICGSDSLTYMNECVLNCVKGRGTLKKPDLQKVHDGSCDPDLDEYLKYFWYVSPNFSGNLNPEQHD